MAGTAHRLAVTEGTVHLPAAVTVDSAAAARADPREAAILTAAIREATVAEASEADRIRRVAVTPGAVVPTAVVTAADIIDNKL
jgi:hypothetical protein